MLVVVVPLVRLLWVFVRWVFARASERGEKRHDEEATAGVVFDEAGYQPPTRLATHSFSLVRHEVNKQVGSSNIHVVVDA